MYSLNSYDFINRFDDLSTALFDYSDCVDWSHFADYSDCVDCVGLIEFLDSLDSFV